MSLIGTFTPTKDGGWIGRIHTLTISTKLRFIPNDNRENDSAPAFRVLLGHSHIGDALETRSSSDNPKRYFRVRFDDPILSEPISAALFPSEDSNSAKLVWNRRMTTLTI